MKKLDPEELDARAAELTRKATEEATGGSRVAAFCYAFAAGLLEGAASHVRQQSQDDHDHDDNVIDLAAERERRQR